MKYLFLFTYLNILFNNNIQINNDLYFFDVRSKYEFEFIENDNNNKNCQEYTYNNVLIDSFSIIECNFKFGIISCLGDTVLPVEYYEIKLLKGGKAIVKKKYYWEYVDLLTCHFETLEYNYIGNISERTNWIAPFKRDSIVGILDTNLNEIHIQDCIELSDFKDGFAIYKTGFGDGIIDQYGNKKTMPIYDFIKIIDHRKAFFIRNQFYGIIDQNGIEIFQFQTMNPFIEVSQSYFDSINYYFVLSNDSTLISNGVLIQIDNIFDYIYKDFKINFLDSSEKIYNVTNDYFFVDGKKYSSVFERDGQLIISMENTSLTPVFMVSIDQDKNQTIPTNIPNNEETIIVTTSNEKFGLLDKNTLVIDTIYEDISYFSSNLFLLKLKGRNGICDQFGNFIIEPKYKIEYQQFSPLNKIIDVTNNNKIGYINNNGVFVVQPIYEEGFNFFDGLAAVKQEGKWGFINSNGNNVIAFEYDSVKNFEINRGIVRKNGNWGVINENGRVIIPYEYNRIEQFDSGLFILYKCNYLIFSDYNGIIISDKIFEDTTFYKSKIYKGSWSFENSNVKILKKGAIYTIQNK